MTTARKQYGAKFKARVAIEAIRVEKTLSQLSSQFGVCVISLYLDERSGAFATHHRGDSGLSGGVPKETKRRKKYNISD
ncbi:MAG: hypothetical protein ACRD18_10560 [Terriglobia bacterium]